MIADPLYFGNPERLLYGVYHQPHCDAPNAPAVVLIAPFGEEAIRAHRPLRVLAERLAKAGAPVLRFDYYGAGDSGGMDEDVCIEGMVADAISAHHELVAMSVRRRVAWAGVGLGAAIALLAAKQCETSASQLVLWDPVLNGAAYCAALREGHIDWLAHALDRPRGEVAERVPEPEGLSEAFGVAISEKLRRELISLDLTNCSNWPSVPVFYMDDVASDGDSEDRYGGAASHVSYFKTGGDWKSNDAMNAHLVPLETLNAIVSAIAQPNVRALA
ncbi:MAG: alpha/beta fold hydrolase [Pseudomonadota bacterium]